MTGTEAALARLEELINQGRSLKEQLAVDSSSEGAHSLARGWQRECAAIINELSGGSKAHWVARAYSEAFLVRASSRQAPKDVPLADIAVRVLLVLEQAAASLAGVQADVVGTAGAAAPTPRRIDFDFVQGAALRPVLQAAYVEGREALERGRFAVALVTFSSLLEAIVTDTLTHSDPKVLADHDAPAGAIADWPFEARLACAERAGLIRGGCARLPAAARQYRELTVHGELRADAEVTERDARVTGQVLRVVIRDLDPGR